MDSYIKSLITKYEKIKSVQDVPTVELTKTQTFLFDTLSCMVGGSKQKGINEVISVFNDKKSRYPICGSSKKTSLLGFAFIHSVMTHALDFDDTHDESIIHAGVILVPALMAIYLDRKRSKIQTSYQKVLLSLYCAVDFINRIGLAYGEFLHTGWLPTTLFGPFACVIGCGKLLEFTKEEYLRGLGFAYSTISGNRQTLVEGKLTKRIQPGIATLNGLLSVQFARQQVDTPENIFDGLYGFSNLFTNGKVNVQKVKRRKKNEINYVSLKPYPSCRCTHAVIDAALLLKKHGIHIQQIKRVDIFLTPKAFGQVGFPFSIRNNPTVDAQFSASYCTALALIKGSVSISDFYATHVGKNKVIQSLLSKIYTHKSFVKFSGIPPAKVQITTINNKKYAKTVSKILGSPERPLTEEDVQKKVEDCFSAGKYSLLKKELARLKKQIYNIHLSIDDVIKIYFKKVKYIHI